MGDDSEIVTYFKEERQGCILNYLTPSLIDWSEPYATDHWDNKSTVVSVISIIHKLHAMHIIMFIK